MYLEITSTYNFDLNSNKESFITLILNTGDEPYGKIVGYNNDYITLENGDNLNYYWKDIVNYWFE